MQKKMVMVKNSDIQVIYVVVVLFLTLFFGLDTEANTKKTNSGNDLTQDYYIEHNNSVFIAIPSNEKINNKQIPVEITCPEDISTYTDLNTCTSYISGALNVGYPENSLTRLTWKMTGATADASESTGINQINDYTFNEGETTVTYTLEDKYSNVTTCAFTVTIWDNQVPRLENMPGDITVSATPGECSATVYWREPTAGDNCSSASEIIKEASINPGSIFPVGKTIVYYHAYDAMGNQSAMQSFIISVQDNEPPQILLPGEITINCEDETPAPWQTFQQFTAEGGFAIDNCDIDETSFRLLSETSDAETCPFTVTRIYEISDVNGNTSTEPFLIHVAASAQATQTPALKSGAAEITALGGNWSESTTWQGGVVPGVGDNVTIPAGVTVIIDGAAACDNITIESGGTLNHNGATTLQVNGNWTDNGTYDGGTNGVVEFVGTTPATINGNTNFEELIISKGSLNATLTINGTNSVTSGGSLTMNSGLITIPTGGSFSVNPSQEVNIEETAGFDVTGGTLNTGNFTITNKGLIRISAGNANFGTGSGNEVHTQFDGAFIVSGGTVNIAGRLYNSASGTLDPTGLAITSGIHISNGTVTLATAGNGLSNVGSLNITSAGTFDFNGGTIVFQNPSNAATELDLGLISGIGTKNTMGGTFQFGNGSTPAGATFDISSDVPLDNISSASGTNLVLNSDLLVNQLNLDSGSSVNLNGNALQIAAATTGTYEFPIDNGNGNAIPVTIILTSGTGIGTGDYIEVTTFGSKHPQNANNANYLNRYWTVTFNGITTPSYSINANYNAGDIANAATNLIVGNYTSSWSEITGATVTGNAVNFSSTSANLSFTVLEEPTVTISNSDPETICDGSSVTLTTSATGDPALNYSWTSSPSTTIPLNTSSSVTVSPSASSSNAITNYTYTVTVTDGNGFTATDDIEVIVNPLPTASIDGNNSPICSGENATFDLNGTPSATVTYKINSGTNQTVSLNSTGTATVTVSAVTTDQTLDLVSLENGSTGCSQPVSGTSTVNVNDLPTATINGDNTICEAEVSTISVNLTGTSPWSFTYQRNGANDVIVNNITSNPYTFDVSEEGVYTISALSDANCTGTTINGSATIVVDPVSEGGTIDGETTVCSGTNSTTLTLSGYVGTIQKWQASTDGTNWIDISNINDTYTATNLTQTNTYRAVVKSGVCSESFSGEATITVNPVPTVAAPEDKFYCMGETTFVIPLTSTPEGAVYDISGGAAIGLSDKTGVTQIPAYTAMPGNAVIQITPRLNGCTGEPVTYNVTVNPRPNIKLSKSTETIGSGGSTSVSFSSTTDDVTFSWEIFSIDGAITRASAGSGDLLNQTLFNNSATTGSVTYQITATSPYCEGATINYTVYVHPEIHATISGDNEVCQNDVSPEITFTASGGTGPYTFTYTVNGGTDQNITTTSGNSITLAVPTDVPDTYTYNLVSVAGSAGWVYPQTGTATVTIKPLPELTSSLTPTGICSNEAFNYTPTSNIAETVFSWTRDEIPGISNSASSGADDIDETLINITTSPVEVTYTYTLTVNGCTNTQEVKVMVTQSPELTSNTNIDDICSGTLLEYTPTSSINPGTTFSWYRDADSYGNSANSGTGNISEALYNNSENPITVFYHYTLSSNGCVNPTDFLVEVTVIPAPEVTASASEYTICPNTSIDLFSNSSTAPSLPATILTQDFNGSLGGWVRNPNNNNNGSWIPSSSYEYRNNKYITNGGSQFYVSDMQNANRTSTLTSPSINTQGYTSVTLTFWHYYREGGNSDRARVRWSKNGSNNWTNLVSYSSDQGKRSVFVEETISLPVGESSVYIQFYFDADDDYYWAIDDVEITGVAQSAADIFWTSNTSSWTSTDANPTNVTPAQTTTYTVTYTDPNTGCNGSASTTVTVYPQPEPTIHADYCVVSPKIRLTTSDEYVSYSWQPLPFGETNGNNYVDIDIAGIYTVNVIDANGCSGAASINVSNEYVTNGSFELGNVGFSTPAASNGNQYQYVTDNPSVNNELWPEGLYGIGTNANNYHSNFWGVDHTSGTGNFMIVNGFPGAPQPIVWEQTITNLEPNTDYYFSAWAISLNDVGNDAILKFSINGTEWGYEADLTAVHGVSNNSNPWLDEGRFWGVWNSGSNTSAVLAIVDLQTAPNGNDFGIDDISFGILDPSPAEIEPGSGGDVCTGATIELFANVSGGKEPITYSWVGPNGHTSTEQNPVFEDVDETYDGIYTLTVTDWYGCDIPSETVDVRVYPQAIVDAGDDQSFGCSANTAFQLNGSIGGAAQSGIWSTSGTGTFDDATKLDAIYTYSTEDIAAGTVTLTLTTDNPDGPCSAASDQTVLTINPSPELDVTIENPLCYGFSTGSAFATVSNGTPEYSYSWSNGQTTEEATGLAVGSYEVTVTDANGCYDTETIDIVEPDPLVVYPASFTPPTCYGGDDGTATVNVEGGTLPYVFTWDAATGNQTTQTATGLTVGTYLFTVTDANGCNITSDFVLVTQPDPPTLTCPPNPDPVYAEIGETTAPVELEDPIYDPICQTIHWTMDGATVVSTPVDGIVPSPYTFNAGITTVTYTTVNTAGDILSCSFKVEVIPNDPPDITCIDPAPISATTDMCSAELNIDLPTVNAGSDITWEWVMAGATEDSGTDGITPDPYTFNVGTTTITWTATNLAGSDVCTQTIIVTDDQKPTFASAPIENCVDMLYSAIYAPTNPNPNSGVAPNLLKNPSPDYYTFKAGNTSLNITGLADNCCAPEDMTIHWQIDFADTPDPLNPTGPVLTHASVSGTRQPSDYGSDIELWGDGVFFDPITHTITYWVEDCNGNTSDEQVQEIVITPRPEIIKMN